MYANSYEEWFKYSKKKKKKKKGERKEKKLVEKKNANSLCLEAKTNLGWGHADASWPSRISHLISSQVN